MTKPNFHPRDCAAGILRGFLMGGADVVPGVSGGTVALILGIYQRLVTAISHFDLEFISLLWRRRWRGAWDHVDFGFLICLGSGILLGIVSLGGLMNHLITTPQTRGMTLAAFFGMILASSLIVARMIHCRGGRDAALAALCLIVGASFAYWFTGLPSSEVPVTNAYVFGCGLVAICAMILPGISGAYVLLILGVYVHLTGILKRLPHLDVNMSDVVTVVVFASGCAVGLISFSKILRLLLSRWQGLTMALLCGFMCGALRKIWPFQEDTTPAAVELKHKVFRNYWPETIDRELLAILAIAILAMVFVLAIDRLGRSEKSPSADPS